MAMNKKLERAVSAHYEDLMDGRIRKLVAGAKFDLFYGPHSEPGYPGFRRATDIISQWWREVGDDLIYDTQAELLSEKRAFERWARAEERAGNPVMLDDYIEIDSSTARRIVFGPELAQHVG